jgi:hypothetical protein
LPGAELLDLGEREVACEPVVRRNAIDEARPLPDANSGRSATSVVPDNIGS